MGFINKRLQEKIKNTRKGHPQVAIPVSASSTPRENSVFERTKHALGLRSSAVKIELTNTVTLEYSKVKDHRGKNALRRLLAHLKCDSAVSLFVKTDRGVAEESSDQIEPEDEYDDDGEPTDGEHDRRNFKHIRTIKRKTLEDFVLQRLYCDNDLKSRSCRVIQRTEGSFNHCVFLQAMLDDNLEQEYVLKIPAHGTKEHWQEADAYTLRNEAVIVQHIRHHTECPVPEIIDFDSSLNNNIGAPYTLMKKMSGKSALDLWLGDDPDNMSADELWLNADNPPHELEEKRLRFLQSLAQAMSCLQDRRFDKIGTPIFTQPEDDKPETYGPWWRWHNKQYMHGLFREAAVSSAALFFINGKNAVWPLSNIKDCEPSEPYALCYRGVRAILNMIIDSEPFCCKKPSSTQASDNVPDVPESSNEGQKATRAHLNKPFVLRHDDLDLHNILVDDDGNVTGILDWDGVMAVPPCVGFASIPIFLRRDWGDEGDRAPYATWSLDRYREVYTNAMKAACHTGDAKFTKKSTMYHAILGMFWEGADVREAVSMLVKEIEEFRRVDVELLEYRLGKGWASTRKVLEKKIAELLAPEA